MNKIWYNVCSNQDKHDLAQLLFQMIRKTRFGTMFVPNNKINKSWNNVCSKQDKQDLEQSLFQTKKVQNEELTDNTKTSF